MLANILVYVNSNKDKRNTNFDRVASLMFFLLPENCQYPFGPLFRLLNVFAGTYFLVYDLSTPFFYACLMLIYIAEKTDPQSVCLFILLRLSSRQILIFHILSNCQPIWTAVTFQKLLAFIGTILLVTYFLDSTTIHDLWFISPYIFHKNALCWQKKGPKCWSWNILNWTIFLV